MGWVGGDPLTAWQWRCVAGGWMAVSRVGRTILCDAMGLRENHPDSPRRAYPRLTSSIGRH